MNDYYFKNSEFVIHNYHKKKTFSSFLPGLAGKMGIPLWAFYVNRGQGMASFGVRDKNGPIMEFSPANRSYQDVSRMGFRTFIKFDGNVHEIFDPLKDMDRTMRIERTEFSIEEINTDLNIKVIVTYFGLPTENIAGLVRRVKIINLDDQSKEIELLDGHVQLLPAGVGNADYKAVGNLLRSWMDVDNLEHDIAFMKLRSSTSDSAEVKDVKDGNFYLSFIENGQLIRPIVDLDLIFDYDTSLSKAVCFEDMSVAEIQEKPQVTANKVPCAFTGAKIVLDANETCNIDTLIGYVHSVDMLNDLASKIVTHEYFDAKQEEAKAIVDEIVEDVETKTSMPIFDEYIKQNFLDNLLRGGYPTIINGKTNKHVYYLYSRKHGDLERDYNFFSVAPEFYSQGNGNFRDVCQNRRTDVSIKPEIEDYNVNVFGNLIQIDGYNPLGVNGSSFDIADKSKVSELVDKLFESHHDEMAGLLMGRFTPGGIINTIANKEVQTKVDYDQVLSEIFEYADHHIESSFGEGFWIDHWTYIYDLIDNYLSVYPENVNELLYKNFDYRFYDSYSTVKPRIEKTVISDGKIRQYGAIRHNDQEKINRVPGNIHGTNWLKDKNGKIVTTNLYVKLLTLVTNKFALLDPYGIGIEMEAGKPGWNDAMNGLPGLFGSGVSESIELKRILTFLKKHTTETIKVPSELVNLIHAENDLLDKNMSDFDYWNHSANAREEYRENVRFGIDGHMIPINANFLVELFDKMLNKLNQGLEKALELGNGIYPTFLTYEATKFESVTKDGEPFIGDYGLPIANVQSFEVKPLPLFLEAPARALKVVEDKDTLKKMYHHIKQTKMYDDTNKMYKTSEYLDDMSMEIGRSRAFTKGWLEREANFLHMTYKYLLGLLKAGLYEEYFSEIKDNLVCFMDPEKYGRSTLENSSFIAPDVNPNPNVVGQGFMARLSGSTAETINMWNIMMTGGKPFRFEEELVFEPKPVLSKEFFDENKEVSFHFLGHTKITYVNESLKNTYDADAHVQKLICSREGKEIVVNGSKAVGNLAQEIRLGKYSLIKIFIK